MDGLKFILITFAIIMSIFILIFAIVSSISVIENSQRSKLIAQADNFDECVDICLEFEEDASFLTKGSNPKKYCFGECEWLK